jgi:hypothetical protein
MTSFQLDTHASFQQNGINVSILTAIANVSSSKHAGIPSNVTPKQT